MLVRNVGWNDEAGVYLRKEVGRTGDTKGQMSSEF